MHNFIVTFNIVAPLALYMILGAVFRRIGLMDESFTKKINKLLMVLFIPCNTFSNLARADLSQMGGQFYVFYAVAGNLVLMVVLWGIYKLCRYEPGRLGSIVQGSARGNGVIFGIPLAEAVFGAGNTATMALMLAATVPFYNITHLAMLEICGQEQAELDRSRAEGGRIAVRNRKGPNWKVIGGSILRNGILWSVAAGLFFNFLKIPIPEFIFTVIKGSGACVTPVAFMMVGASFSFAGAGHDRKDLILATATKLVFVPCVFMVLPILQRWPAEKLLAMLVAFAAPTAIISYPMARDAGCDGELSAEIVASTVVFSMFTIFLWIFAFKHAGLM
jgi:predicted permease